MKLWISGFDGLFYVIIQVLAKQEQGQNVFKRPGSLFLPCPLKAFFVSSWRGGLVTASSNQWPS
jgi:hypothetical protein